MCAHLCLCLILGLFVPMGNPCLVTSHPIPGIHWHWQSLGHGAGFWKLWTAPTMAAQHGKQLSDSYQSVVGGEVSATAVGTAALFAPRLWARHPVLGYQPVEAAPALHTHSEESLPPSPCRLAGLPGMAPQPLLGSTSASPRLCRCYCTFQHVSRWVNNIQPEPQCVLYTQTICSHCCRQCPSSRP